MALLNNICIAVKDHKLCPSLEYLKANSTNLSELKNVNYDTWTVKCEILTFKLQKTKTSFSLHNRK